MDIRDEVLIIDSLPEPTLLVSTEGVILGANAAGVRLFQQPHSQLIGSALSSLVAGDPADLHRYLGLCSKTSEGIPADFSIRTPGSEAIRCRSVAGPARSDDGEPTAIRIRLLPREWVSGPLVGKTANALHLMEDRFERLVDGVQDYAIFMVDADGLVISWNRGAARMNGYRAEEVIGRPCAIFYSQEAIDKGRPEAELRTASLDGHSEQEGWRLRKDGSRFWANVLTTAIRDEDRILVGFSKIIRDLTERKRAEEALNLQVAVLQYMPAVAWTLTADGRCDFVNRQWLEYTGQTAEFVLSSPEAWMTALHPEDHAAATRLFWDGVHSGQGFTMETRFRRASDGAYRWHLTRGVPLRNERGDIVKFVGTTTDIESLKQAEDERRKAEERIRMIVESALDAVIAMDVKGDITEWNNRAEEIFGWRRAEVLGRRLSETIIPLQYRDAHAQGLRRFHETGQGAVLNRRIEISALRRDGREFPVELTVTPMHIGGTWIFNAFLRDITERKLAEEKLRVSELNLRQMTETIPEMLWSATPEGAIDYCNGRLLDYTGFPAEELMGDAWLPIIHPDDVGKAVNDWRSSVSTGTPYRVEVRIYHFADLTYRWCVTSALPLLDRQGRILKWHGTVVDMHDWKRAQEDLRNAQAALAHVTRVMTMGELTASIAHEVNQPLAAIVASGDSCSAWLAADPPNTEKARAAAARIVHAATQASEVVQRIRALFGKAPVEKTAIRINDILYETLSLTQSEMLSKDIAWHADLAAELPEVLGDRIQLQQVILNLIMNGMDAMTDISGRSKRLLIQSSAAQSGWIAVSVADTGIGIDPEHNGRLFDPFFTTKPKGIGMGLSISRSIIEAHGGKLWAGPNQPGGAIFQFVLPPKAADQ